MTTIEHKAGFVVHDQAARECVSLALKMSGLDYGIDRERIMTLPRPGVLHTVIPNRVSLFRDDTHEYLATVGQDYQVVPNREVFLPLDAIVSNGQYEVDLVGEFNGGRKAFVLLKGMGDDDLRFIDTDDKVGNYLLFTTSHDGKGALRCCVLPYRFTCSNVIAGAMAASGCLSLVHNSTMKKRMKELLTFVKDVPGRFDARCEEFKRLSSTAPTSMKEALAYLEVLDASNRIIESVLGTQEACQKNLKSWWTLYNGYNSYLNHECSPNPETRLKSVFTGQSCKRDTDALTWAIAMSA